jgi:hypothetical protein
LIRKIGASNQSSFYGQQAVPLNFSKIRVGVKNLEDATLELGDYKKINPKCANKADVLRAINNKDIYTMREISNFFFDTSGIYSRLCRYLAYLYRYDWMVTPQTDSVIGKEKKSGVKKDKIIDGFYKTLNFLDKFEVKKFFGEVALKVIKSGCYYG